MKNNNDDPLYNSILKIHEMPLVYFFAKKFEPGEESIKIKFLDSNYYQSTESIAEYPLKKVSKCFDE